MKNLHFLWPVLACAAAFACSGNGQTATVGSVGGSSGSGPVLGVAGTAGLNLGGTSGGVGTSGAGGGGGGVPSGDVCGMLCPADTCSPETCDGVDNNCDGIIDNVDKNSDGICDCLLIATLGIPGTWGQGDVFSTWLSARSNNGATALADQTLTPALLAQYEVIVAQDVHLNHQYSAAEAQALHDWVAAGGGFMTLIGFADASEVTNVNRLLSPFGMHYGNQPILPKNGNSTVPITTWTPHPVDLGVTAVGVDNGYEALGTGTVIATNGSLQIGLAQDVLPGHVLVWGDEWITYDSEWTQHPDYQVELFWVNAIKWLTAANKCQVAVPPDIGGPPK
jgi:hypothetical protein